MATLEELERIEAEQHAAEAKALRALAAHLREAVIDLPVQSPLALKWAQAARKLDQWSRHQPSAGQMGGIEVGGLVREVKPEGRLTTPFDTAAAAVRDAAAYAADNGHEPWVHSLERIADSLDGAGRW